MFTISLRPSTIYRAAGFFSLYVVSVLVSYFSFTLSRVVVREPVSPVPEERAGMFDLSPIPTPASPTAYHILLLGYGGEGHSGGRLSDSLTVVRVEPEKKRVVLVSVPRDVWIALPTAGRNERRKINQAFALGGGELAKRAVSTVVGLPIQYFVAVSFDGLKEAIDALGGVDVRVPKTFDDPYFPVKGKENETCGKTAEEVGQILTTLKGFEIDKQFPCRFERVHFEAGLQHMDGETVLVFVRSRHSAEHGGDFARNARQQAVLWGIREKLLALGALDDAVAFFHRMSFAVETDIDEEAVRRLALLVGNTSDYAFTSILLSDQSVLTATTTLDGQSVLLPNEGEGKWEGVRAYIAGELEKEND